MSDEPAASRRPSSPGERPPTSGVPAVRDGMPARAMAALLADPAQRAAHVAALVDLVESNGYAGIDLDYEQFALADGRRAVGRDPARLGAVRGRAGRRLHAEPSC